MTKRKIRHLQKQMASRQKDAVSWGYFMLRLQVFSQIRQVLAEMMQLTC